MVTQDNNYNLEYGLISSMLATGLTAQAREVISWLEPEMFATYNLGALYANIRKQARFNRLPVTFSRLWRKPSNVSRNGKQSDLWWKPIRLCEKNPFFLGKPFSSTNYA